jgi:O-antigen ligase
VDRDDRIARYFRGAALLTAFLYSAGYSSVGFALLLGGSLWAVAARRTFPWARTVLDLPLGAFGLVLLVSAARSPYQPVAAGVTAMLVVSGAVYLGAFLWLFRRDPSAIASVLRAWAWGALLTGLAGLLLGLLTHARAEIPRGVGPNGLGTTLALGSVVATALGLQARGRDRWTWMGSSFVILLGLLATGSRASLAGWIAGSGYLAWKRLRGQPLRLLLAGAAGMVAVLVAGLLVPQLATRLPNTARDILGDRIRIWEVSAEMIRGSPWVGTGFGTFGEAYNRWKSPEMSPKPFAHDLWLNIAVETGLLGLACAVWIGLRTVAAWRGRPPVPLGGPEADLVDAVVPSLWIALLVDQLADNTLFSISTSAVLWMLLALSVTGGRAGSPEPASVGEAARQDVPRDRARQVQGARPGEGIS